MKKTYHCEEINFKRFFKKKCLWDILLAWSVMQNCDTNTIVCLSAYRKTHMETWILSENIFFSWFSFLIVLQVLHIFLCKNKSPLRPLSHFSGLSSIESIIDHTVSLSEISLVFFIYLTWRYNFFYKNSPSLIVFPFDLQKYT